MSQCGKLKAFFSRLSITSSYLKHSFQTCSQDKITNECPFLIKCALPLNAQRTRKWYWCLALKQLYLREKIKEQLKRRVNTALWPLYESNPLFKCLLKTNKLLFKLQLSEVTMHVICILCEKQCNWRDNINWNPDLGRCFLSLKLVKWLFHCIFLADDIL